MRCRELAYQSPPGRRSYRALTVPMKEWQERHSHGLQGTRTDRRSPRQWMNRWERKWQPGSVVQPVSRRALPTDFEGTLQSSAPFVVLLVRRVKVNLSIRQLHIIFNCHRLTTASQRWIPDERLQRTASLSSMCFGTIGCSRKLS